MKLEACRQQKFIYRLYGGMCKKEGEIGNLVYAAVFFNLED